MPDIARSDDASSHGGAIRADGNLDRTLGDLTFIRIDHQARLQLGTFEIVIETPFALRADGAEYALDPEDRGGLGPFLALYPDELTAASVAPDGTLQLAFGRGAAVTVPPDPRYEAWQINGPGTALIVCLPSGAGLAVWV